MSNWFDSKNQLSVGSLTAFGISISSRYSRATEMIEMLQFCQGLAVEGLEGAVGEVFYDSKSDICNFVLNFDDRYSDLEKAILEVAKKTVSQFEWHGVVKHGTSLYSEDHVPL